MYHIISLSIRQFNEVWKISCQKSIRQLLGKRPFKEIKTAALVLLFWVCECWYLYQGHLGSGNYIGECGCWYLCRWHAGAGTYIWGTWVLVLMSEAHGCWYLHWGYAGTGYYVGGMRVLVLTSRTGGYWYIRRWV